MNKTKIDWCDSTWNPVTGCLHGCEYCYARGIANRFGCHATPDDKVSVVIHPWEDSETGLRKCLRLAKKHHSTIICF